MPRYFGIVIFTNVNWFSGVGLAVGLRLGEECCRPNANMLSYS